MILTFLSAIPESTGLLIVGSALMLGSVVLRRIFVVFEGGSPAGTQPSELKDRTPR
jgi:hypothetical protein